MLFANAQNIHQRGLHCNYQSLAGSTKILLFCGVEIKWDFLPGANQPTHIWQHTLPTVVAVAVVS